MTSVIHISMILTILVYVIVGIFSGMNSVWLVRLAVLPVRMKRLVRRVSLSLISRMLAVSARRGPICRVKLA